MFTWTVCGVVVLVLGLGLSMWTVCGVVVLVLVLVVKQSCPYLLADVLYMLRLMSIGRRLSAFRLNHYTLLERFMEHVERQPHKTFIRFQDQTVSYQETEARSNQVARVLLDSGLLKGGQTVGLFLGNDPWFFYLWLGLVKMGCSAALLNYNMRSKSLLHCFERSGATVLIAAQELKAAVEEVLPTLVEQNVTVYLLAGESSTPGLVSFTDKVLLASEDPLPSELRSHVTLHSPAVYIYTSGTTGLPKAAMVSHQKLWAMSFLQRAVGVKSDDVIYVNLPLYHTAGFMAFTGAIERGITIALKSKFSASQFWDDCRKYDVTVIQYIGETMRYLCNTTKKANDRDHSVRIAIGNGIRADVWREFLKRFGDVCINELYASTEGNISLINYIGKVGAVGRVNLFHRMVFPYAVIKYDAEKEEPVRDSTTGLCIEAQKGEAGLMVSQITVKTPFSGYAGDLEQTEKKRLRDVFQKGDVFFNTGDLLLIDQDGFIYFTDRIGDTFRWKGENVSTNEVSDVLTAAPSIREANVYGVKVPGHEGRIGMAAVTLTEGHSLDCVGLFNHVENFIPAYARPRFIRVKDSLELTGTFKQMKVKLMQEGFDPDIIAEPLYFLSERDRKYIPFTKDQHQDVLLGRIKL